MRLEGDFGTLGTLGWPTIATYEVSRPAVHLGDAAGTGHRDVTDPVARVPGMAEELVKTGHLEVYKEGSTEGESTKTVNKPVETTNASGHKDNNSEGADPMRVEIKEKVEEHNLNR